MNRFLAVSILVLALIPCAFAQEKVVIPGAVALSGLAASYGTEERNAIILAVEECNRAKCLPGKQLQAVFEDTASTNKGTIAAVRKLISLNRTPFIIGPTWLDSYQGVLPIVNEAKVLVLAPSAAVDIFKTKDGDFPLVFSTWFGIGSQTDFLLAHFKAAGKRRVALLVDQDPYFQGVLRAVQRDAGSFGVELAASESVDLQSGDLRPALLRLNEYKADALLVGFGDEGNLVTFLKQRPQYLPAIPVFGTEYLDGYASRSDYIGLLEGVTYAAVAPVEDRSFYDRYTARFKESPILSAATAYDAVQILLQALAHGCSTNEEIVSFMRSHKFESARYGELRFSPLGGVRTGKFVLRRVEQGKTVEVK